jgi:hypothetical protein
MPVLVQHLAESEFGRQLGQDEHRSLTNGLKLD